MTSTPVRAAAARPGWGAFPALALVASAGVLLFAFAFTLARQGSTLAGPLFWIGFVVIGAPITVRLASATLTTFERISLVIVLGLALYLVHYLLSPIAFTGYDELLHLRSLTDILGTGHLFSNNSLLDVSPLFPALEVVTAAVAQVSGADPFIAAVILLAFVRVLFALALFALYREASFSARVAGLATAIYMLNPNFTFFDSAFAYESMALPLVPLLLVIAATRARIIEQRPLLSASLVVVGTTLVFTHHVTSYEAAALLVAWLLIHLVRRRNDRYRTGGIALAGVLVLVGAGTWLLTIAQITIGYLAPPLTAAVEEMVKLVSTGAGRTLFQSSTGAVAPLWERLAGLGMAGLLTLAMPFGLVVLVARLRDNSVALLLGAIALGYPASLIGRLTPTGSEAAGRTFAVIFLGLAFAVSLGIVYLADLPDTSVPARPARLQALAVTVTRGALRRAWQAGFVACVTVLILGGVVAGSAPETRLPGPYLVGADSRSIDAESVLAATWARDVVGPGQYFAADRVNRLLLGSYGDQHVVFHGSDGIEEWQPFLAPFVGDAEIERLMRGKVRYLLIDQRLSWGLPLIPFYYEEGEIFEAYHTEPVALAVLTKWDHVAGVDRLYDSGHLQVYDVGGRDGTR